MLRLQWIGINIVFILFTSQLPGCDMAPADVSTTADPDKEQNDSLTAGLVILAVLLVALIAGILLIFFCCCRRGRNTRLHTRRQMAKYRQDNPPEENGYKNEAYDVGNDVSNGQNNGPISNNKKKQETTTNVFNTFITSETRSDNNTLNRSRMLSTKEVQSFTHRDDDGGGGGGDSRRVDPASKYVARPDERPVDVPRSEQEELDRRYKELLATHALPDEEEDDDEPLPPRDGAVCDPRRDIISDARGGDVHYDNNRKAKRQQRDAESKHVNDKRKDGGGGESGGGRGIKPTRSDNPVKSRNIRESEALPPYMDPSSLPMEGVSSSLSASESEESSCAEAEKDKRLSSSSRSHHHETVVPPLDFGRLSEEFVAPPGDQPLIATAAAEASDAEMGYEYEEEEEDDEVVLGGSGKVVTGSEARDKERRAKKERDNNNRLLNRLREDKQDPTGVGKSRKHKQTVEESNQAEREARKERRRKQKKRNESTDNKECSTPDTPEGDLMKTASIIDTYMADFINAKKKSMDKKYAEEGEDNMGEGRGRHRRKSVDDNLRDTPENTLHSTARSEEDNETFDV